jgi:putative flippase GtrA
MAHISETIRPTDTLRSAARFGVVGVLGTLIDFTLFSVLNIQVGIPVLLANSLSYSAGIVNNYFFHRFWTYAQRSSAATIRQFSQFVGLSLSALALNNLMMMMLAPVLSKMIANQALGALGAKICATALGMSWNFLANHLWTFRNRGD